MTQWLRDLGAILKVGGGVVFAVALTILIADAFIVMPVFLADNVFTWIMWGVMMLLGGYGIEAIFGE